MIPQGKVWQVKAADQPIAGPVGPTPATGTPDRSDHHEQPVRPVEPSAEDIAESAVPALASRIDEVPPAPPAKKDEELVDYEASPERNNLEINVVHMFSDYSWFRKRRRLIFSLGLVMLCFRSPKNRVTI
jgi:hypothetical protein